MRDLTGLMLGALAGLMLAGRPLGGGVLTESACHATIEQ
jgi:hypothetical protein